MQSGKTIRKSPCALALVTIGVTSLWSQAAQAQSFAVTIENPGVQSTSVAGAVTETFDNVSIGHHTSLEWDNNGTKIGTYTTPDTTGFEVLRADQYGGAGGTNNYFAVGSESGQNTATLNLVQNQGYFGMWWSAGDNQNVLKFYENGTLEFTYNTQDVINFINGLSNASSYYGNPNAQFSGKDTNEPFAYLNFYAPTGVTFNQVEFDNTQATGFESDNHSVAASALQEGLLVVPEPPAWAMMFSFGLVGMGFLIQRKRKSRRTADSTL